jgi:tRNA (guanine-N7-)-methyltransferase
VSDRDPAALVALLETETLRERGPLVCVGPAPLVLEIGFGRAELLIDLATLNPERHYLGVEVSRKRAEKAARRIERLELPNAKVVQAPAEYLLERVLPRACIAECWINFPDPWPKKRHFRRRFFQPEAVARVAGVLEPGAVLHAATDHGGYAEWMADALASCDQLENLHAPARWSEKRPERRLTGYEAEWLAEGRQIAYFDYRRLGGSRP